MDPLGGFDAGSTVVVVLIERARGVVLWAGDSRAYRWRASRLERLTCDHAELAADGSTNGVITRAVGGEDQLELDERAFDVEDGDRLLLCSDGVHAALDDGVLREMLGSGGGPAAIAARIREEVLAGAARDNLTALVICAGEPARRP